MASEVNSEETVITNENSKTLNSKDNNYDVDWLKGTSAEVLIKKNPPKKPMKNDFSSPVYKKLSKLNGKINDMSMDQLINSLSELDLDTSGKKEVLVKRLKSYHKENNLKSQNMCKSNCDFDYICVIDYEATCTETQVKEYPHEIIEFPIVLINMSTLTIDDYFSWYCRPIINPKLSKFCTELTGIKQDLVDNADEFPIVLEQVKSWFKKHELGTKYKFAIATDGPWDMQNFLNMQCSHSKILYPNWAKRWIDVRKLFSNWFGVRRCGITKMLEYCGFQFEGQQHCGLDDAKNIARVLIRLAKDGCDIKLNDSIKKCLTQIEKKTGELDHYNSNESLEFPEE